ncbi:MAG: ribonuclease P protein component [Chloroflexi bacterium]|nr:ribonuclease P protein component [Chloroflexota bacterium]
MLTRERRLRRSDEFESVRRRGRRVSNRLLVVTVAPSQLAVTRWGLSVSKRVGGSVTRNRVKRLIRENVRTLNSAPGHDVVVIARSGVSDANFLEVREALLELLRQTSIIVDDEGAADQT